MISRLLEHRPLRVRLFVPFVTLDFTFKAMLTWVIARNLDAVTQPAIVLLAKRAVVTSLPLVAAWCIALRIAIMPIEAWEKARRSNALTNPIVERAAIRLQRLPLILGCAWVLEWDLSYGVLAALHGAPLGVAPVLFFLVTMAAGPMTLAYLLTQRLTALPLRDCIIDASRRGIALPRRRTTLSRELVAIGLGLGGTPALYISSVVFVVRERQLERDELELIVTLALAATCLFVGLATYLLASGLTDPLRQMQRLVTVVARQGDVSNVTPLPVDRRDEIGDLAQATNEMIARLAQAEERDAAARRSLAALAATLESRVAERTARLEAAMASLQGEMAARLKAEAELRQSQKLESVGRLAAGVAHEINTPIQFVSDSIHFVRDATVDLMTVLTKLQDVRRSVLDGAPDAGAARDALAAEEAADLDYLEASVPKALDRCLDGVGRVATIVRSMKDFAHPDGREMAHVDLNRAIESTLTIARNEYKYVADLETDLGSLPPVRCHVGDVNQVVLNIVVNAAHAIADVVAGTEQRGRIFVSTRRDGDSVVLRIVDTGGGIPAAIRDRIFDPFFTTKEVGRGTGQGLAIARSVIVEKHGGDIDVETEVGVGTTFVVRLPIEGPKELASEAA